MNSSGTCALCKDAKAVGHLPDSATPIGQKVIIRAKFGRGHDQTTHTFSQCAKCGSVWVTTVDGGAGGHGYFNGRLTKDLF